MGRGAAETVRGILSDVQLLLDRSALESSVEASEGFSVVDALRAHHDWSVEPLERFLRRLNGQRGSLTGSWAVRARLIVSPAVRQPGPSKGSPTVANMTVMAATPQRWNDVVAVFGRRGNDPGWCWCRRFLDPTVDGPGATSNREALRREIDIAHVAPGLVAYVDGAPAGWTRVMPRSVLHGVRANRALRRVLADDPGAWWVTCFAVAQPYRNGGVATALLHAAVAHARQHGATAVEGHPVDTDALTARHVSGSALFTGTMRTFLAAGFTEIARTYPSRPVMRLEF